jgi:hypothetical protein
MAATRSDMTDTHEPWLEMNGFMDCVRTLIQVKKFQTLAEWEEWMVELWNSLQNKWFESALFFYVFAFETSDYPDVTMEMMLDLVKAIMHLQLKKDGQVAKIKCLSAIHCVLEENAREVARSSDLQTFLSAFPDFGCDPCRLNAICQQALIKYRALERRERVCPSDAVTWIRGVFLGITTDIKMPEDALFRNTVGSKAWQMRLHWDARG